MTTQFSDLGIHGDIIRALKKQGIFEPFEVQKEAIPDAMLGHDICCRAPTGSGKTLAFGLPLISRCKRAEPHLPTSLILTPTRELAEQICSVLIPIAHAAELDVLAVYGGTSYTKQFNALERGIDILVACPGRLIDLLNQNALSLEDTDIVVIDEADRMADMGFMEPVCDILDECARERQTILFSATLDDDVARLIKKYQHKPSRIEVGPKEISMDSMKHFFWLTKNSMKSELTSEVIKTFGRSIVFCRTRAGVDRVAEELEELGIRVSDLHGGLTQGQRNNAMKSFASGENLALIATDVAARGIDIEGVKVVIHYDPPENSKAYKHRSGRTARAGANGVVISLVQKPQKRTLTNIQKQVGIKASFTPPNFDDLPESNYKYHRPPPRKKPKNQSQQGNRRGRRSRRGGRNQGRGSRGGERNQGRGSRGGGRNQSRGSRGGGRNQGRG
ncbi:MAG: DEAD/DEAH box helicase, partial [Candidatus Thermoplasmatota archaeon]|nr:DEAD/DEAH box helicase [Candidatus Thermoplasmatota archaeon]